MSIVNNECKHLYTHCLSSFFFGNCSFTAQSSFFFLSLHVSPHFLLTFLSHEHSCVYYIKGNPFFVSTYLLLLTNTTTDEIHKSLPPHHGVSSSLLLIIVIVFPSTAPIIAFYLPWLWWNHHHHSWMLHIATCKSFLVSLATALPHLAITDGTNIFHFFFYVL